MSIFSRVSERIRSLIFPSIASAAPVIKVYPWGRQAAIKQLYDFIAEATFYRKDSNNAPIAFQINRRSMYSEWPDNEVELELPCIACIPGTGEYKQAALTPFFCEDTYGVFGPGTVVEAQGTDYSENVILEVWSATRSEREAIISGLEYLFSPSEGRFGLTMKLAEYYGVKADYLPMSQTLVDDADSARNRRKSHFAFNLVVPVVRLVNAVEIDIRTEVQVLAQVETEVQVTVQ
jgi:hypothetical protein